MTVTMVMTVTPPHWRRRYLLRRTPLPGRAHFDDGDTTNSENNDDDNNDNNNGDGSDDQFSDDAFD
jgi:hypothetical protein